MFALLTAWLAGVFLLMSRERRNSRKRELGALRQSMQKFFLEVLSHQRHDWMNELQLVFSYSKMGRNEKIHEIVNRVSGDMHAESRLAKLGLPEFVFYLMTVKAENREVELHVKAEQELHFAGSLTSEEEECLIRAVRAGVAAYRYSGLAAKAAKPALRIVFGEESGEATLFIEPENDPLAVPVLHRAFEEALEPCSLLAEAEASGTLIRWKLPLQT
ncbi:Spo0B domain-containing protein [Saccharibacillus sp. CPCC 101409]|uniref:Spo0B domain-containing protein n=1 Tax=Saccharibacillus sp. CPCC 101409 TaxID=3058041 RepID=UPI002671D679|nr:Spo0B domain-containing protein [Saccharibacillus sp. CPCC 101409]MDO3410173.1 Spo0B domain-containing protein [Saccharibacillus sp. CPCC 101409]